MDIEIDRRRTIAPITRQRCLVDECSCKDARIVSTRRAAFFAVIARVNGETADRTIAPESDWHLPTGSDRTNGSSPSARPRW